MSLLEFDVSTVTKQLEPEILLDTGPHMSLLGVNPRSIMGYEYWDNLRSNLRNSYGNCCAACGKYERLEAHETYFVDYQRGFQYLDRIIPLCYNCHMYIHRNILRGLQINKKVTASQIIAILEHGKKLLRKHGLKKSKYQTTKIPHKDWRFVYNGEYYPPRFCVEEIRGTDQQQNLFILHESESELIYSEVRGLSEKGHTRKPFSELGRF